MEQRYTFDSLVNKIRLVGGSDRVQLLVDFLNLPGVKPRLMTAPASTKKRFHHAYPGGLLDHTYEVLDFSSKALASVCGIVAYGKVAVYGYSKIVIDTFDLVLAAVLHDIHKIGDDCGNVKYATAKPLKSGKISEVEPYETNEAATTLRVNNTLVRSHKRIDTILSRNTDLIPDGEWSLALVAELAPELFASLSEAVKFIIRHHDGMYGLARRELAGKEDVLQMTLHWADMMSSRLSGKEYALSKE